MSNQPLAAIIIVVLLFLIVALGRTFQHKIADFISPLKAAAGSKLRSWFAIKRRPSDRRELMRILLGLNDESLAELLELYKIEFGPGAARYARKTYRKWRSGEVAPVTETFERFLLRLPKVMTFDLKCEVLRRLMDEFSAKDNHKLTVYTDDWEEKLPPLVEQIVIKANTSGLPREVERRLRWLAEDETQLAQEILRKSRIEQGRIAVSMLREEMAAIESVLAEKHLRPKVVHKLKFPCGTITLNIKRR